MAWDPVLLKVRMEFPTPRRKKQTTSTDQNLVDDALVLIPPSRYCSLLFFTKMTSNDSCILKGTLGNAKNLISDSVLLCSPSYCNVPGLQMGSYFFHQLKIENFILFYSIKNTIVLSMGPALVYLMAYKTPGILIFSVLFRNVLIFSRKAQDLFITEIRGNALSLLVHMTMGLCF